MPGPRVRESETILQALERAGADRERNQQLPRAGGLITMADSVDAASAARVSLRDAFERFESSWAARTAAFPTAATIAGCNCDACLAEQMRVAQVNRRAEQLLLAWLNEKQANEYRNYKRFTVKGASGAEYLILVAPEASTYVLSGEYQGSSLCIQLHPDYAPADAALARKLLIETDEQAFLRESVGLRRSLSVRAPSIPNDRWRTYTHQIQVYSTATNRIVAERDW